VAVLSSLIDKALVFRTASGRYSQHNLIQRFARKMLVNDVLLRDQVKDLYCKYFASYSEHAVSSHHTTHVGNGFLSHVTREIDNIKSAVVTCVESGKVELIGQFLFCLIRYYDRTGHAHQGIRFFSHLNDHFKIGNDNDDSEWSPLASRLYYYLGALLFRCSDYDHSREMMTRSLSILERQQDNSLKGDVLIGLGNICFRLGEYLDAKSYYVKSLLLHRAAENYSGIVAAQNNIANVARRLGDYIYAKQLYEDSFQVSKNNDDRLQSGMLLIHMGISASDLGDYNQARQYFTSSLEIFKEENELTAQARALCHLGDVELALGNCIIAKELLQESLGIRSKVKDVPGIAHSTYSLACLYALSAETEKAKNAYEECIFLFRDLRERYGLMMSLNGLAMVMMSSNGIHVSRPIITECVAIASDIGEKSSLVQGQILLGYSELKQNRMTEAENIFRNALEMVLEVDQLNPKLNALIALASVKYRGNNDEQKQARDLLEKLATEQFLTYDQKRLIEQITDEISLNQNLDMMTSKPARINSIIRHLLKHA